MLQNFPREYPTYSNELPVKFCRLQGIVASMSRMPTFRRRFRNLVKVLCLEAMGTHGVSNQGAGSSKFKGRKSRSMNFDEKVDPELGSNQGVKIGISINWAEKKNDGGAEIKVEDQSFEGINIV